MINDDILEWADKICRDLPPMTEDQLAAVAAELYSNQEDDLKPAPKPVTTTTTTKTPPTRTPV